MATGEKNKKEILNMLKVRVERIKTDASNWAIREVATLICRGAYDLGIHEATCLKNLRSHWSRHLDDPDEEVTAIMWQACHAQFDFNRGWEVELEKKYMDLMGYVYKAHGSTTKPIKGKSNTVRFETLVL